jgi:hypothetical protein
MVTSKRDEGQIIFRRVREIAKQVTFSFVMYVCPYAWNNSAPNETDF